MSRIDPRFFEKPIAHRGLHDRESGVIENSMSAIRAAISGGYGIEIDLQPASDGTPMVFHDYLLDRLTAEIGPIKSRSAAELEAIVLSESNDGIPKLSTVLDEVNGKVPLLIEIKDQDLRLGPDVGDFQDHVCECLSGYDGPVALMSFSPDTMARAKACAPDISMGLVTDPFQADDWPNVPEDRRNKLSKIADVERIGADFISHKQQDLSSPVVSKIKNGGLPVFCWTIRSQKEADKALQIADNITFEGFTPARRH